MKFGFKLDEGWHRGWWNMALGSTRPTGQNHQSAPGSTLFIDHHTNTQNRQPPMRDSLISSSTSRLRSVSRLISLSKLWVSYQRPLGLISWRIGVMAIIRRPWKPNEITNVLGSKAKLIPKSVSKIQGQQVIPTNLDNMKFFMTASLKEKLSASDRRSTLFEVW